MDSLSHKDEETRQLRRLMWLCGDDDLSPEQACDQLGLKVE